MPERAPETCSGPVPRYRDTAATLASVLGAGALVAGLAASAFYGARLLAVYRGSFWVTARPGVSAPVGSRFVENRQGSRDTLALPLSTHPTLLLVYSSSCKVCSDNMPRWLDLVEELRRSGSTATVYAVDLDGRDSLGEFWPDIRGVTRVSPADRDAFLKWTGVPGTPTSAVVRAGSVDAVMVGIVGPHRRRYLVSRLRI